MDKTTSAVSLIVVIIFAFLLGALAGIFYQKQTYSPQMQEATSNIQKLSSKVVSAVVTYGRITSIDENRNVTLDYGGETLTVSVMSDAKIYIYENSTKKELSYSDIKVGDSVNITATVDSSGILQGNMVVIFSRSN